MKGMLMTTMMLLLLILLSIDAAAVVVVVVPAAVAVLVMEVRHGRGQFGEFGNMCRTWIDRSFVVDVCHTGSFVETDLKIGIGCTCTRTSIVKWHSGPNFNGTDGARPEAARPCLLVHGALNVPRHCPTKETPKKKRGLDVIACRS